MQTESTDLAYECEFLVIIINLLSLQLHNLDGRGLFPYIVAAMRNNNSLEFAARVRDDVYLRADCPPRTTELSNLELQNDIDYLLQKWRAQGTTFSILYPTREPEGSLEAKDVLRNINHQVGIGIFSCSVDTWPRLIVACGIALSQRRQVIAYNQCVSFITHCRLAALPNPLPGAPPGPMSTSLDIEALMDRLTIVAQERAQSGLVNRRMKMSF